MWLRWWQCSARHLYPTSWYAIRAQERIKHRLCGDVAVTFCSFAGFAADYTGWRESLSEFLHAFWNGSRDDTEGMAAGMPASPGVRSALRTLSGYPGTGIETGCFLSAAISPTGQTLAHYHYRLLPIGPVVIDRR